MKQTKDSVLGYWYQKQEEPLKEEEREVSEKMENKSERKSLKDKLREAR